MARIDEAIAIKKKKGVLVMIIEVEKAWITLAWKILVVSRFSDFDNW